MRQSRWACDRCHRSVQDEAITADLKGALPPKGWSQFRVRDIDAQFQAHVEPDHHDLCPDCTRALVGFMEGALVNEREFCGHVAAGRTCTRKPGHSGEHSQTEAAPFA